MGQSSDWITYIQPLSWEAFIKIALAALLGAAVGLERVWGNHPAGLRTNMLIAISSCVFTILSIEGFPLQGASQDTARVAAQIVTGVGFLGAGALLQAKGHVRGLTTAASIWLVAAIGMAVGTGFYFVAIFTTILSTFLLVMLAPVSRQLERQARARVNMTSADQQQQARYHEEDDDMRFED